MLAKKSSPLRLAFSSLVVRVMSGRDFDFGGDIYNAEMQQLITGMQFVTLNYKGYMKLLLLLFKSFVCEKYQPNTRCICCWRQMVHDTRFLPRNTLECLPRYTRYIYIYMISYFEKFMWHLYIVHHYWCVPGYSRGLSPDFRNILARSILFLHKYLETVICLYAALEYQLRVFCIAT